MVEAQATNVPEISVSELSGALKRTIEDRFGFVRVRGEISNYRGPHSSGHAYFCLKDESARIDAVVWKTTFQRLRTKPQEGLEIIATGKVSTYPGKSSYQLIIEAIEPAGIGALMALYEDRRRRLAAEGLFDEARKQLLPFLPRCIGVVTSPTGAVIRDILHRIADRFPCHVVVWPVRVQGETSAAEVTAAIEGLNRLAGEPGPPTPELIIVARGGGSLEDLWSFNEETVVRAAAASLLPLISAIGHETDWTLVDFAADLRAPTPTGAAEKAVPVRLELLATLADLERRHHGAALRLLDRRRADLRALARALPQGEAILASPRQRLDRGASALSGALTRGHDRQRIALAHLSHRLARQSPHATLARVGQKLEGCGQRMLRALALCGERRAQRLQGASRLTTALAHGHDRHRIALARVSHRIAQQSPQARLAVAGQKLGACEQRLVRCVQATFERRLHRLDHVKARLETARATRLRFETERIMSAMRGLEIMGQRQALAFTAALARRAARLQSLGQLLQSLGYTQVLSRGFALVRDREGRPLRLAAQVEDGDQLVIQFADGRKAAVAGQIGSSSIIRRGEKMVAKKSEQGSLF